MTALKRYGLMLAAQGSPWYVTGTSDPRWEDALDQLRAHPVRGSDFELLASGDDDLLRSSAYRSAQSFRALPSSVGLTAPTPSPFPVTTRR